MKKYYASLIGPLLGVYYPLPDDIQTDNGRRVALNTSKLRNLWCSVYTEKEVDESIAKFGGIILPDNFARKLDFDSYEVSVADFGDKK